MAQAYRSSIERFNAPYRGITSREDMVNFDLATMHDMFHVQKTAGGNLSFEGHKQQITNNLLGLREGETNVTASIPTAGDLVHSIGYVEDAQDLSNWVGVAGGAAAKVPNGFSLKATGLLSAAGVTKIIRTNPGDVIMIRLHLKKGTGKGTKVAIGALNFDNDGDDLDVYDLDAFSSGKYIDKRLYCRSSQDIKLVVYAAYETTQGTPVEVSVRDFSVEYLKESPVGIKGLEKSVKTELEIAEQLISFIEERVCKARGGIV